MPSEEKRNDPVAQLRHMLAADAFALFAQPIGAIGARMTYPMAEVLVRLHEEEKAMLPPGEFFSVLEHYGMMPELDRWVVRQALRRLATGCRIPSLCINLSAQTLADSSFPAFVAEELLALGVEGDRILFEIEEADAIAVPDCLARFAATVGSLGAGIIIESFGRASDAWAPLKVPCLRYVKLHGSLTRQVLARQALTEEKGALLQTAYATGIELIADFVEELHALRRLKTLNIGYVQGIGVYEPHPLDSFGEREAQQVA